MPCVLDKCLGPSAVGSPAQVAPGDFDFYVLSLSWSPSFCARDRDRSPEQCATGANPGFVVHGLWPQNRRGFPEDCDGGGPSPSRLALRSAAGLYPDEGLARHEWRRHGTCTGLSPSAYFAAVRHARDGVTIPPDLAAPTRDVTWTPNDVARRFMAANRGLRLDTMGVTCRGGDLEEVRLCLGKDLRGFVPCPAIARQSCRQPFTVPAAP